MNLASVATWLKKRFRYVLPVVILHRPQRRPGPLRPIGELLLADVTEHLVIARRDGDARPGVPDVEKHRPGVFPDHVLATPNTMPADQCPNPAGVARLAIQIAVVL